MHYFGSDLDFRVRTRFSKDEYEAFFSESKEQARGEASVWYLFSKNAAEEIYEYDPNMTDNGIGTIYLVYNKCIVVS